ncbi:hypothetical protein [Candidatus Cytomitobacter primus]|uniref:Uncharacterized protein n=1 Tax=Candidatus Cytomitobacter primus TaxID=2066024 RepID=A0A5C0UEP5_9PROT|nr:hypothetical protein [Candidatus Cytomitobacter primus]QEK38566.1 hypothetical protein FZC34_01415 [Candidatus Cytomitobacter primus]
MNNRKLLPLLTICMLQTSFARKEQPTDYSKLSTCPGLINNESNCLRSWLHGMDSDAIKNFLIKDEIEFDGINSLESRSTGYVAYRLKCNRNGKAFDEVFSYDYTKNELHHFGNNFNVNTDLADVQDDDIHHVAKVDLTTDHLVRDLLSDKNKLSDDQRSYYKDADKFFHILKSYKLQIALLKDNKLKSSLDDTHNVDTMKRICLEVNSRHSMNDSIISIISFAQLQHNCANLNILIRPERNPEILGIVGEYQVKWLNELQDGSISATQFVNHYIFDKRNNPVPIESSVHAMWLVKTIIEKSSCGFTNPSQNVIDAITMIINNISDDEASILNDDNFDTLYSEFMLGQFNQFQQPERRVLSYRNDRINLQFDNLASDYLRYMMPLWFPTLESFTKENMLKHDDLKSIMSANMYLADPDKLELINDTIHHITRRYSILSSDINNISEIYALLNGAEFSDGNPFVMQNKYIFPMASGVVNAHLDKGLISNYKDINGGDLQLSIKHVADIFMSEESNEIGKQEIRSEVTKFAIAFAPDIMQLFKGLYNEDMNITPYEDGNANKNDYNIVINTLSGYANGIDSVFKLRALKNNSVVFEDIAHNDDNRQKRREILSQIFKYGFSNSNDDVVYDSSGNKQSDTVLKIDHMFSQSFTSNDNDINIAKALTKKQAIDLAVAIMRNKDTSDLEANNLDNIYDKVLTKLFSKIAIEPNMNTALFLKQYDSELFCYMKKQIAEFGENNHPAYLHLLTFVTNTIMDYENININNNSLKYEAGCMVRKYMSYIAQNENVLRLLISTQSQFLRFMHIYLIMSPFPGSEHALSILEIGNGGGDPEEIPM